MSQAHLTWVDPTTRTDNKPLKPEDIAYIAVFMSADGGNNFVDVAHVQPGVQMFDQDLTDAGTYFFRLAAVDKQSPPRMSAYTASVSVVMPAAPPNAPGNFAAVYQP